MPTAQERAGAVWGTTCRASLSHLLSGRSPLCTCSRPNRNGHTSQPLWEGARTLAQVWPPGLAQDRQHLPIPSAWSPSLQLSLLTQTQNPTLIPTIPCLTTEPGHWVLASGFRASTESQEGICWKTLMWLSCFRPQKGTWAQYSGH